MVQLDKIKNFIFDLDGTLINSSKEVLLCMDKAFAKAKFPIDKSRLTTNVIGPPLKEILQLIAPNLTDEDKLSEIMQYFRDFYDDDENDISEIYDGVYDLLNYLKANNCRIFMATFKPTYSTMRIIKQFKLDYFEDIYTIDKFGKHITKSEMIKDIIYKYSLIPEETVMIGDASTDMTAAKQANIKGIGALWGYGDDKTELIKNSDITLKTARELWQKLNYQIT